MGPDVVRIGVYFGRCVYTDAHNCYSIVTFWRRPPKIERGSKSRRKRKVIEMPATDIINPFAITDTTPVGLLDRLLKLSSLIDSPMQDAVAAPNGISLNELKIIMCLAVEGPLAGHDITEILAIPPMNVSRAISALRERGWIESIEDPNNRRRKPVRLSNTGWEECQTLLPDVGNVAEYLLGHLTQNERATLARVVDKILFKMTDWIVEHHAGVPLKH